MSLFKIKHVPTGRFYTPVTGSYSSKTNLTKNGKVYHKKPSFKHMSQGYHYQGAHHKFVRSEWIIVEIITAEGVAR